MPHQEALAIFDVFKAQVTDEDRQGLGYGPNTADEDSDDKDDEIF